MMIVSALGLASAAMIAERSDTCPEASLPVCEIHGHRVE